MKKTKRGRRPIKSIAEIRQQAAKTSTTASLEKHVHQLQKKMHKLAQDFQKQLAKLLSEKSTASKRGRRKSQGRKKVSASSSITTMQKSNGKKRRGRPSKKA